MCDYCSWIDQILARIKTEVKVETKKPPVRVDPVIIVHGGAGKIPRKHREYMLNEVKDCAIAAYTDLINGCSAVDAVEKAISHLESKPYFNCAKGGSLDVNDEVVTDAAIVTTHQAGCVGAVRDIEHPITLARKVMENTEQVLIVENGAQMFALETGIPILPPGHLSIKYDPLLSESSLSEEEQSNESFTIIDHVSDNEEDIFVKDWEDIDQDEGNEEERDTCEPHCFIQRAKGEPEPCHLDPCDSKASMQYEPIILQAGAVGAVAYDRKKRLASGTSTSGQPGKPVGSISAIGTVIGCGVYADENGCVSVSGDDTEIYCYAPAREIIRKLGEDTSIDSAVAAELENFEKITGESNIGVVVLNAKGESSVSFKCMHFPWALCRKGYVYYGCKRNEQLWEEVTVLEKPLDCMCADSDEE